MVKSKAPKSKGSVRSLARSIKDGSILSEDLDSIDADKITKFYKLPNGRFRTEHDVIRHYGYELGDKLGHGGFAVVYFATQIKTKIQVACKKVNLKTANATTSFFNLLEAENREKSKLSFDDSKIEDLKNELIIMKKLQNPYIVKLYAHFVVDTSLFIFMKLANNGALDKYVQRKGVLSERESQVFFAQILVGVEYMHSLNIAHRDIKLENILLLRHPNQKLTVLITDFGLSRVISVENNEKVKLSETRCGTSAYMAPEILERKPFNSFLVDVWALGVLLYVMLNNKEPFFDKISMIQIQQQKKKDWKLTGNMAEKPTDDLVNILMIMLEPNPLKRPKITVLTQHPWIINEYSIAKNFFNSKVKNKPKSKQKSKPKSRAKNKPLSKPKSKVKSLKVIKIVKDLSKKKIKKKTKSMSHKKMMSKH